MSLQTVVSFDWRPLTDVTLLEQAHQYELGFLLHGDDLAQGVTGLGEFFLDRGPSLAKGFHGRLKFFGRGAFLFGQLSQGLGGFGDLRLRLIARPFGAAAPTAAEAAAHTRLEGKCRDLLDQGRKDFPFFFSGAERFFESFSYSGAPVRP